MKYIIYAIAFAFWGIMLVTAIVIYTPFVLIESIVKLFEGGK